VEWSTRENKEGKGVFWKSGRRRGWERKNAREAVGFLHRLGRGLGGLDGRKLVGWMVFLFYFLVVLKLFKNSFRNTKIPENIVLVWG
jgi:hypothetical protein